MRRRSRELWFALGAIVLVSLIYLGMVARLEAIPRAGDLFGHGLGILGFLFMLMTETLYSLRKRSRRAHWGRMSTWLRFHIFTGLVGPYMVLLHTSWKFNGVAGIVTALTIAIVISGIVGRYIYTAVPRTADGAEVESAELERQIAAAEAGLQRWRDTQPEAPAMVAPDAPHERRGPDAGPRIGPTAPPSAIAAPSGSVFDHGPQTAGDLAHGAYSYRHGALCRCLCPHRSSHLLCHAAQVGPGLAWR
jgi:hypothetical protein